MMRFLCDLFSRPSSTVSICVYRLMGVSKKPRTIWFSNSFLDEEEINSFIFILSLKSFFKVHFLCVDDYIILFFYKFSINLF